MNKKECLRLMNKTIAKHSRLGNWIYSAFAWACDDGQRSECTLPMWIELDRQAEILASHHVIAEAPYYALESGWFRALVAQVMVSEDVLRLKDAQALGNLFYLLGWDLADAIKQDRLLQEQTTTKFKVAYPSGEVIYHIRVSPKWATPVDSYWLKLDTGKTWRIGYHPKDNKQLCYMECQDGVGAIGVNKKDLLNVRKWRKL